MAVQFDPHSSSSIAALVVKNVTEYGHDNEVLLEEDNTLGNASGTVLTPYMKEVV